MSLQKTQGEDGNSGDSDSGEVASLCKIAITTDENSILADEWSSLDEVNGDAATDKADLLDNDAEPGKEAHCE